MFKMTEYKKQQAKSYMNLAYKAFITIGMAILLKSVPVAIYDAAVWMKDIEDRTISTVETRIDLERHMQIWTLEAQSTAFKRLKAVEDSAIQFRKADSITFIKVLQIEETLRRIENNQNRLLTELK